MKLRLFAAALASAGAFAAPLQATAAVCSPFEPPAYAASLSDVTLGGIGATSCGYYDGNDNKWMPAGSGWTKLGKSDDENPITGSVDLVPEGTISLSMLLTPPDDPSGDLLLSWAGGPALMDFTFVLKASNKFIAYTFLDFLLTPADGTAEGSYVIAIANKHGVTQDLSHMTFWARGERTTEQEDSPGSLPEPGALALLGIGAFAAVWRRRRTH